MQWSANPRRALRRTGVVGLCLALALLALAPFDVQSAPSGQAGATWQVIGEAAQLRSPSGVAVDVAGTIYVADAGNHRVVKLGPEGRQMATWGSQGTAPGQFDFPSGIAVDGAGYVYVADTFNQRIQKLTPDGQPVLIVGEAGTGAGQFRDPHAVAVDPEGTMYVADTHNNRVQKFSPYGEVLAEWGNPDEGESGVEPNPAARGRAVDQFRRPKGIATDDYGRLIVTDTDSVRIVTLAAESGQLLNIWTSLGGELGADPSPGVYRSPRGVAVDLYGQVYVTDTYSHRVQLLAADGNPLAQWGAEGGAPGELRSPSGVAVDRMGALYVADTGNHRIQRLAPASR